MDMQHLSAGKIGGGYEKAVAQILVHEADHQVQITARFEERLENRILLHRPVCDRGDQILQDIAG